MSINYIPPKDAQFLITNQTFNIPQETIMFIDTTITINIAKTGYIPIGISNYELFLSDALIDSSGQAGINEIVQLKNNSVQLTFNSPGNYQHQFSYQIQSNSTITVQYIKEI